MTIFSMSAYCIDVDIQMTGKEVVLGEKFQMILKFEYSGEIEPFVSFEPVNAELVGDNTNSNNRVESRVFFSAGKAVQKKIYQLIYEFQPVKTGFVHIRDIKVDTGGEITKLRSQSLKVLAEAKDLGDFIVRAEVSKEEAYKNEGINLNYYLYFKTEITQPEIRKFPTLPKFIKRFELPKGGVERISLQGEIYKRVLLYKAKIFPEDDGELKIDPIEVTFQYPEMSRTRRDVFGMSLLMGGGRYKSKTLRSKTLKINVLPLPAENVPANFTGLVGEHKFALKITKERILVNDVIEARLEVTGDGALEKFDPPKLIKSDSFEEFDPKTEIVELGELSSKKIIDYTYLGKHSVELSASSLKLSIFDPEKRAYVEKEIQIPALQVFGSGASTTTLSNSVNVSDKPKEIEVKNNETIEIVAPLFSVEKAKLFNYKWINYTITALVLLLLFSMTKFSNLINYKSDNIKISKNLTYKNIHEFITSYGRSSGGLRDLVRNQEISEEAKKYLMDIIENAEKNEYKGKQIKLNFNRKYFVEYAKAQENEKV